MTDRQKSVLAMMASGIVDPKEIGALAGLSRAEVVKCLRELVGMGHLTGDLMVGFEVTPTGHAQFPAVAPAPVVQVSGVLVFWDASQLSTTPEEVAALFGVSLPVTREVTLLGRVCKARGIDPGEAGEDVHAEVRAMQARVDPRVFRLKVIDPMLTRLHAVSLKGGSGFYYLRDPAEVTAQSQLLARVGVSMTVIPVGAEILPAVQVAICQDCDPRLAALTAALEGWTSPKVNAASLRAWKAQAGALRAFLTTHAQTGLLARLDELERRVDARSEETKASPTQRTPRPRRDPGIVAQPHTPGRAGMAPVAGPDGSLDPGDPGRGRNPSRRNRAGAAMGGQVRLFAESGTGVLPVGAGFGLEDPCALESSGRPATGNGLVAGEIAGGLDRPIRVPTEHEHFRRIE